MIHKSSIIHSKAKVSSKAKIGPFCYIGENVSLDEGVELISNVHIEGNTKIGKNTKIFPFASIGTQPQDLKFKGEKNNLVIGQNNIIREYVTINPGTEGGGGSTKIGDNQCKSLESLGLEFGREVGLTWITSDGFPRLSDQDTGTAHGVWNCLGNYRAIDSGTNRG